MKHNPIAITRSDGGVSIMYLADDDRVEPIDINREIVKVSSTMRGMYVSHQEITEDIIPKDETFRDAWKFENSRIDHDEEKVKNIYREKMAILKRPIDERKLESIDVEELARDLK